MSEKSFRLWTGALGVGAFVGLMVVDVMTEAEPIPPAELFADALQLALILASTTGVALLSNSFRRDRLEKETLIKDLRMAQAEGSAWRTRAERYLSGLSIEIEQQFEDWQLTEAEREVGLLMLKGFAHGEIARLRGTTEATVRHQARAAYQKSGMPGRSAFCAFFLEDLLISPSAAAPKPAS